MSPSVSWSGSQTRVDLPPNIVIVRRYIRTALWNGNSPSLLHSKFSIARDGDAVKLTREAHATRGVAPWKSFEIQMGA